MSDSVGYIIQDVTQGKPFVFVIMAYKSHWPFYKEVKRLVHQETGLLCIRADEVSGAGHDLLQKIHLLIDRADLVLAEISTDSPNVFYEVGYAIAKNRPLMLLAGHDREVPTDLKGRELIRHGDARGLAEVFEREFCDHLRARVGSRLALLRDMLLADEPTPAYIVASPRYPTDRSRIPGQRLDRRTFSDNLGVRGLLQAFGAIIGGESGVELVSGQYCPPDLVDEPYSLYLVGSKKVNPPAGDVLRRVQPAAPHRHWYLGRIPKDPKTNAYLPDAPRDPEEGNDYACRLYEIADGACVRWRGEMVQDREVGGVVHRTDYGLLVRAPHPKFPRSGRLVLLMAGAHSLGTGAACLAATRTGLIRKVRAALPATHRFEDKGRGFWVLLRGTAAADGMLDESGVEVVRADWYPPAV